MTRKNISNNFETVDINSRYGITISYRTDYTVLWFETAHENLITAKILLNTNRYPHCIFFLQQSIECIIKGILLENKIIQTDDLKIWSHNPEKAIEEFYKLVESYNYELCIAIKKKITKYDKFSERLEICVQIVNYLTNEYNKNLYDFIEQHKYIDNLIYCFAVLFNNSQQNTRYPTTENIDNTPSKKYTGSQSIKDDLYKLILLVEHIYQTVLN